MATQEEHVKVIVGGDTTAVERAMASVSEKAKVWSAGLVEHFKGIATGLGGIFAAGKITEKLFELGREAKEIIGTAETRGFSEEGIQGLRNQVKGIGKESELADRAIEKLAIKIGQARSGSAEAQKSFEKWHITLKDTNGVALSTEDVLRQIADRTHETEDGTLNAAMAFELLGKQGAKLVEVLKGGSAAMDKAKASWKIFSHDDLETLVQIWEATKGIGKVLTYGVAKPLIEIVDGYRYLAQFAGALTVKNTDVAQTIAQIRTQAKHLGEAIDDANENPLTIIDKEQVKQLEEIQKIVERLFSLSNANMLSGLTAPAQLEAMRAEQAELARKIAITNGAYGMPITAELGQRLSPLEEAKAQLRIEELKRDIKKGERDLAREETQEAEKQAAVVKGLLQTRINFEDNFKRTLGEAAAAGDPAAKKAQGFRDSAEKKRLAGDSAGAKADLQKVHDLEAGTYTEDPYHLGVFEKNANNMQLSENQRKYWRGEADRLKQGIKSLKNSDLENDPFTKYAKDSAEWQKKWDRILDADALRVKPLYTD